MKEKVKSFLRSKKGGQILLVAGMIGIVLIYLSTLTPKENTKKSDDTAEEQFSVSEYTSHLEQQVREIVAAVSGDTGAVVTVTLDGGITYVYAEDKKQNNKAEENETEEESERSFLVVKDSDGAEHPLIVTTKLPEIRGVAIVCGPIGEATEEKIKGAVMAAFDLTQREVYIANRN